MSNTRINGVVEINDKPYIIGYRGAIFDLEGRLQGFVSTVIEKKCGLEPGVTNFIDALNANIKDSLQKEPVSRVVPPAAVLETYVEIAWWSGEQIGTAIREAWGLYQDKKYQKEAEERTEEAAQAAQAARAAQAGWTGHTSSNPEKTE